MAPKEIVIFGAGGMGREVRQIIERINLQQRVWRCLGFLVDERFRVPEPVHELPVLTGLGALGGLPGAAVVVAVGDPAVRREIVERIRLRFENPFATLVDPRATCGDYVRLGPGTVVAPGAVITTDVVIGDHVIINVGASVSHDARLVPYADRVFHLEDGRLAKPGRLPVKSQEAKHRSQARRRLLLHSLPLLAAES